jgi:CheY-like chemotaxis protein
MSPRAETIHAPLPACDANQSRWARDRSPVLVVEDHAGTRNAMRRMLESSGYVVCTAEDGLAALECLDVCRPRLILLDLVMPIMDGFGFAQELRGHVDPAVARLPILLITGTASTHPVPPRMSTDSAQRLTGAVGVLRKPFEFQQLIDAVRQHSESPSS